MYALFRTFSIKRLINALKAMASYYLSFISKKAVQYAMPVFASIEPTVRCQLHCSECITGCGLIRRECKEMARNLYIQIINELAPYIFHLNLYWQGEPLLYQHIFDMIAYANKRNIYTTISTNGQILTKKNAEKIVQSGLNKIIISVDGTTQETYQKYRAGGNLNQVIEGIGYVRSQREKYRKKSPLIIVQFLVFRHNEHQTGDIKKLGKRWGADKVKLKTAQILKQEHITQFAPKNKRYSRYAKNNRQKKANRTKQCLRIWTTIQIACDGNIVPCCFDKNAFYRLGKINENDGIRGIWQSKTFNKFRKSELQADICRNCPLG